MGLQTFSVGDDFYTEYNRCDNRGGHIWNVQRRWLRPLRRLYPDHSHSSFCAYGGTADLSTHRKLTRPEIHIFCTKADNGVSIGSACVRCAHGAIFVVWSYGLETRVFLERSARVAGWRKPIIICARVVEFYLVYSMAHCILQWRRCILNNCSGACKAVVKRLFDDGMMGRAGRPTSGTYNTVVKRLFDDGMMGGAGRPTCQGRETGGRTVPSRKVLNACIIVPRGTRSCSALTLERRLPRFLGMYFRNVVVNGLVGTETNQ